MAITNNDTAIFRFDNSGDSKGLLDYTSVEHVEDLDGVDKLTVRTRENVSKRDRLVWRDNVGDWHEHMVDHIDKRHSGSFAEATLECSNSISELYGIYTSETKVKLSVQAILELLCRRTRWTVGTCSDFGKVELELYHKNVRECIAELVELVDGELETQITVNETGVTSRMVRIVSERGRRRVMRQFSYGRNVNSTSREIAADEVYTAIIGYGAKLDKDDRTDYPVRMTVTVESGADLRKWGIPSGDGLYQHNYTTYTDNACTSKTFLTKQCTKLLKSMSQPVICYSFEISQVDDDLWRDVGLGDYVMCVDELFSPSVELIERVSRIRRRLTGHMECVVEIGKRAKPHIEQFRAVEKSVQRLTGNSSRISGISPISTGGNLMGDLGGFEAEIPTTEGPVSIKITTPPDKLRYSNGETIDFTGIVVTLYDENEDVYTDEWHPDGTVPMNELIFPVTVAEVGSTGDGDSIIYEDVNGYEVPMGNLDTPKTKWTDAVTPDNWAFCNWGKLTASTAEIEHYHYYTPRDPNAVIYVNYIENPSGLSSNWRITAKVEGSSETIMFDFLNGRYGNETPSSTAWDMTTTFNSTEDPTNLHGYVFSGRYKTVFVYGDEEVEYDGLPQSVPVQYQSGDTTLEDSFTIKNSFWGSGGGKF